ncbi:unnamed protein product [Amaranthus hypochondriacus]
MTARRKTTSTGAAELVHHKRDQSGPVDNIKVAENRVGKGVAENGMSDTENEDEDMECHELFGSTKEE